MSKPILTDHQWKKFKAGICVAHSCSKSRTKEKSLCPRCAKRRFALNNPEKHVFDQRKANALRRGKVWTLTFDEFLWFLNKNPSYMTKRGRKVKSLSIDRHKNHLGYTKENIRCVTVGYNSWKRNHVDYQSDDPSKENYCGF